MERQAVTPKNVPLTENLAAIDGLMDQQIREMVNSMILFRGKILMPCLLLIDLRSKIDMTVHDIKTNNDSLKMIQTNLNSLDVCIERATTIRSQAVSTVVKNAIRRHSLSAVD